MHQTIIARGQEIQSNLTQEKALYARDAIAKVILQLTAHWSVSHHLSQSLYDRTFTWLVKRINESLLVKYTGRKTVMGLLDIYGFEIMQQNRRVFFLK